MFCIKCGAAITSDDQFCKSCGEKVSSVDSNNNELNNSSNNDNNSNGNVFDEPVISMTPIETNDVSDNNNSAGDNSNTSINNDSNNNVTNMSDSSNMNKNTMSDNIVSNNNNTSNNNVNNDSSDKNDIIKYCLIAGGVIVILIVVFLIGFMGGRFSNKGNDCNVAENVGGTSSGGDATPVSTTSTYKVSFGGFSFQVPDTMIYDFSDNALIIGNLEDTWMLNIVIVNGSIEPVQTTITRLKSNFDRLGYDSKNVVSKKIGGIDFITAEISDGGYNTIFAYSKASSSSIFAIAVYTINNDFGYDVLEEFAPVLKSAEAYNNSISIKPKGNFDANKAFEAK